MCDAPSPLMTAEAFAAWTRRGLKETRARVRSGFYPVDKSANGGRDLIIVRLAMRAIYRQGIENSARIRAAM